MVFKALLFNLPFGQLLYLPVLLVAYEPREIMLCPQFRQSNPKAVFVWNIVKSADCCRYWSPIIPHPTQLG